MILDEIMAYKRDELERQRLAIPLADLRARAADQPPPLDFAAALGGEGVRLIAEVKRASPSRGVLCPDFDPVHLALIYAKNGAAAISVLTDNKFFQGKLEYLSRVKSAVSRLQSPIPVLRKDFIFDPYQVAEARAFGADALLLIVGLLSDKMLSELLALTHDFGMTALIEVHDEEEVARALRLRPHVVGINNRNLRDFSVDLSVFGRLRSLLSHDLVVVAESGVQTVADIRRLGTMGADAVLVGEALITAYDMAAKVREFVKGGQE
jgi:indole-3-glycerol phosphate synthase